MFDGYHNSEKSTKTAERLRRKLCFSAATVVFDETMSATMPKERFLSNDSNKERLISMLRPKLEEEGYRVKQAHEDADTLIVSTAVDMAKHNEVVAIVGEDTDLLVLLTALAPPSSNIFLLKPGKGATGNTIYSPSNFKLSQGVKENILFLHAFSGCDSTSALYMQGKMKFAKLMEKDSDLVQVAPVDQQVRMK